MRTIDEIKQKLNGDNAKKRVLKLKELGSIPELLRDNETVKNVFEIYGGQLKGQQIGTGLLFSTEHRLVLVHHKPFGEIKSEECSYSSISEVQYKSIFPAELILTLPNEKAVIKCSLRDVPELAEFVYSRLVNPPQLVDLNPHAGKPFPKWRALFLILLMLLFYIIYGTDRTKSDASITKETAPAISEGELDSCFISGESAATAYISDMAKYASSGLMPSTVMEKGCERKGNETANPKACIDSCEMGFRKIAKDVLNGR